MLNFCKQVFELHHGQTSLKSMCRQHGSGPKVINFFHAQLSMKFSLLINIKMATNLSLLINMKMPTLVGIFIFISIENFMLSYI